MREHQAPHTGTTGREDNMEVRREGGGGGERGRGGEGEGGGERGGGEREGGGRGRGGEGGGGGGVER